MTKEKWMPTVVLSAICLVVAGLLATINIFTGPRIERNQKEKAMRALTEVYPGGTGFAEMDLSTLTMPESVVAGYTEASGGYVFRMSVTGKDSGMIVMCGIDAEGKIVGTKCIESKETPGYFASVLEKLENTKFYNGKDQKAFDALDFDNDVKVSGSTLSSKAYNGAIKDALLAFASAGGADIRPIEQIKSNEALGTETVVFEKWFAYEVLEGVSAVYTSSEGYVYVIDGSYVGVKDGAVVGTSLAEGVESVDTDVALAADAIVTTSVLTAVEKPAGMSLNVLSIQQSTGGCYVIEVKAKGYSQGNEHYVKPGAQPIVVRVAIDLEGKIISTLTVSHQESNGYGDVCGTPEYYEQYNGKTADTYDEVPMIVGSASTAPITSKYYKEAIQTAFDAFEILTGGDAS